MFICLEIMKPNLRRDEQSDMMDLTVGSMVVLEGVESCQRKSRVGGKHRAHCTFIYADQK